MTMNVSKWDDTVLMRKSFYSKSKALRVLQKLSLCNQETLDAKGYPAHLGEEKIPLEARILSTADTFED